MIKKILFIFLVISSSQTFSRMEMGVGGARVASNEGFGAGGRFMESMGAGGTGRIMESMAIGGSGRITEGRPGSFDIGGFDGMRTLELPTSFDGNIGGRF